jgi:hypothetical protein
VSEVVCLARGGSNVRGRIYLITMVQSLESNGSPVIEPYFLSGFHAHSMISSIAIVTNVRSSPAANSILTVVCS